MTEKVDRRVRKTRMQLREGLARLMQKKSIKEISVRELVDEVDINRSTFYLHYTDIYQMLEKIEEEAMEDILQAMDGCPPAPAGKDQIFPYFARFFSILDANRDLALALLGPNGDMAFVERIEHLLSEKFLITSQFLSNNRDAGYAYAFCLNGCVGMIKSWLSRPSHESPETMAELTYHLIDNTAREYLR